MQLIPVIICSGTDYQPWPVSQASQPESFIQLADDYNLLQKSILRGAMLQGVQKIVTVANRNIFHKIQKEFNKINLVNQNMSFILEPEHRSSAAAVTAAALHIAQFHEEDTLMLVLAVDDLNIEHNTFQQTIKAATKLAFSGKLVTFGMLTSEANTNYHDHKAFKDNVFVWNSDLFLFEVGTFIEAMKEERPDILSATSNCLKRSDLVEKNEAVILDLDAESFFSIPEASINEELIKASNRTVVIPCDIGWLDQSCQLHYKSEL